MIPSGTSILRSRPAPRAEISSCRTVSTIAPIFPLLVLILTLIFRPQGLFGKKGRLA